MSRIACVGETLVDLFADTEVADVGGSEYFHRAAGGAVSNVAVGIARLGGNVTFVGTIGQDPFGRFLMRTLAHENVNVDDVRTVVEATSVFFVARGPHGAREFYPIRNPGADSMLAVEDLNPSTFEQVKAIHFGGVLLASEPGRSATMAAAALGRKAGLVTFDPNVRRRLFPDRETMRRVTLEACAASHIVKCSDDDLDALGFANDDPASLLGGMTETVVVTRGARGCRWATKDGRSGEARAPRIDEVDTTGAGDAFMAALLWRLVYHYDGKLGARELSDAVRYAVAAGALACTKEGAIPSLPRSGELEAMLAGSAHQEQSDP